MTWHARRYSRDQESASPDRQPEITRLYVEMVGEVWLLTITSCESVAEIQAFHQLCAELDATLSSAARRVLSKLTASTAEFITRPQRTPRVGGFGTLLDVDSDVANVAKTIKRECRALMALHPRLRAWPFGRASIFGPTEASA